MLMLHIKLKGIRKFSNIVTNILLADPPTPISVGVGGSVGQNLTYSEHGHVAYQIKENSNAATW